MSEPGAEEGDGDEDFLPLDEDFLPLDGVEGLEAGKKAEVTKYLRMLRTAKLSYLDKAKEENRSGLKDFLTGAYRAQRSDEAEKAQSEWNLEKTKYGGAMRKFRQSRQSRD
jgi:hypothetical protein